MSTPSIAERVAAGVEWLDANRPGWVDDISAELDMSSRVRCVMGQIYGHYWDSPMDGREEAVSLGFLAAADVPDATESEAEAEDAEYAELTAEWRRVIEERRQAAGVTS